LESTSENPRTSTQGSIEPGRATKRWAILTWFVGHLGEKFQTNYLHGQFGPSFRSRVSELNRDDGCPITILNHTERLSDGCDASCYWAVRRAPARIPPIACQESLFGDLRPEGRYPD
jgi:hypothetical protein